MAEDWKPNYDQCTTLPEIIAVLLDGAQRNFAMVRDKHSYPLRNVIFMLKTALRQLSFTGSGTYSDAVLENLPSDQLISAVRRIIYNDKFFRKPFFGAVMAEVITNPLGRDEEMSIMNTIYTRELSVTEQQSFELCQTPTDIVALLSTFIANAPSESMRNTRGAQEFRLYSSHDWIYSQARLLLCLSTLDTLVAQVNSSMEFDAAKLLEIPAGHQFRATVEAIMKAQVERGQPFSDLHTVIGSEIRKHYKKPEVHESNETIYTGNSGHEPEVVEPKPEQQLITPLKHESPTRLQRYRTAIGAGIAAMFVACASVTGIGGIVQLRKYAEDTPNEAPKSDDTASPFEDTTELFHLTSKQLEQLKAVVATGDKYYVPFVEALMQASSVGITSDGRVSNNPAELIAGLHSNNERLHDLIINGQVRTYVAHPGREVDIHFGQSVARLVIGKLKDAADDLMVLDRDRFFGDIWHRDEVLEHETGHRNPTTKRDSHTTTGGYDRSTAAYGETVIATADYSYYISTMFSTADTIISGEIHGARSDDSKEGWHAPTKPADQLQYAEVLAKWFMENNTVLNPYGVDQAELVNAITSSHLIDLANQQVELDLKRIHDEAAARQPKENRSEAQRKRR